MKRPDDILNEMSFPTRNRIPFFNIMWPILVVLVSLKVISVIKTDIRDAGINRHYLVKTSLYLSILSGTGPIGVEPLGGGLIANSL